MSDEDPRRVAGHLLRRCLRLHDTIFAQATAGHDITPPQLAALVQIARQPKIELSALADLIAYDAATIGGIVDRLEAKALVSRTPGTRDRRKKHLTLTKAGRALLAQVEPKAMRVEEIMLKDLALNERAQFLDVLCRITGFAEAADDAEHLVA
jgi:MarR family transcriptional regulator, temperature-dependent positive regulator of motility